MKRIANSYLIDWKSRPDRKPLIINGARQVGKSYLVREFGEKKYSKMIEINFEKQPAFGALFEYDLDAKRILRELQISLKAEEIDRNTLIFLDEIQFCPKAIMSLRYFYEDTPDIPIIAAGSLLDFEFRKIPYPVGRIETLNLYPMSFCEYLIATGNEKIVKIISETNTEISPFIENKIYDELYKYFWIGGMPGCIANYLKHEDLNQVRKIQEDLLFSFQQDYKKYQPEVNIDCLNDVFINTSTMIGQQILYSHLSDRFSGPTIKKGVDALCSAGILTKIENVSLAGLPFVISGKQFKLNYLDIGLLIASKGLPIADSFLKKDINNTFQGTLAEQFVGQELKAKFHKLYYWDRTVTGSNAEIDYVIAQEHRIIPIEVKSGKSGSLKSLHVALSENPAIEKAIVFSQATSGKRDKIEWIPLYRAGMF